MAMSDSSKPSPQDVAGALAKLSYDQTRRVVFHLGVDQHVLEDVDFSPLPNNRSIQAIQSWFDKDIDPSWKKLILALKRIRMDAVAAEIAAQHYPELLSLLDTGHATTNTDKQITPPSQVLSPPLPAASTTVSLQPALRATSMAPANPSPSNPNQSSTSSFFWDLDKVHAAIHDLEEKFLDLNTDAEEEICDKEVQDKKFLRRFRKYIQLLPASRRASQVKFFRECEREIQLAEDAQAILGILCRYMNFLNPEILRLIIVKFCGPALQKEMQDYCKMLEVFEMSTTVDVYVVAAPDEVTEDQKKAFSEMVVRINKPASQCTLQDVRKLNEAILANSGLCPHSVYISGVADKCVEVVFKFPYSVAGWMLVAFTPAFMEHYQLTQVSLNGECLTTFAVSKHALNAELITACKSENLVKVASLLNSVPNVKTLNDMGNVWTPVHQAWAQFDIQSLHLLIGRGLDVDHKDEIGMTALAYVVVGNNYSVTRELLALGADVNVQDHMDSQSVLMNAFENHEAAFIVELIKAGANVHLKTRNGRTALMKAAYWGKSDIVIALLNAGALIDIQDNFGETALIVAARMGDIGVVRELLREGANVNLLKKDGMSALTLAASKDKTDVVMELVKVGANVPPQIKSMSPALVAAADKGETDFIMELVIAAANKNKAGEAALMMAVKWGKVDIVVDLLKDEGTDIHHMNKDGETALMKAAYWGMTDIVIHLINAGANMDTQHAQTGDTALMIAASEGKTDVVVELIRAGANLHLQNKSGDSAVIRAAQRCEPAAMSELVRAGSDLNLQNQEGLTALMIAVRTGAISIVEILLKGKHIILDIRENNTGWTALFFATDYGDILSTRALINEGANPDIKDRNGVTAVELSLARWGPDDEISILLTKVSSTAPTYQSKEAESGEKEEALPTEDETVQTEPSSSSIGIQDTVVSESDVIDTNTIISRQRRRRGINKALKNLVNRSRKTAVEVLNRLEQRLKSVESKKQAKIRREDETIREYAQVHLGSTHN